MFTSKGPEELLSSTPSGSFQISSSAGDIHAPDVISGTEFACQIRNKGLIFIGVGAAQTMIQMTNTQTVTELVKHFEKRHRVRSSGHTNKYRILQGEHASARNHSMDLIRKSH